MIMATLEWYRWAHAMCRSDLSTTETADRYESHFNGVLRTWRGNSGELLGDMVEVGIAWRVAVNTIRAGRAFLQWMDELGFSHTGSLNQRS